MAAPPTVTLRPATSSATGPATNIALRCDEARRATERTRARSSATEKWLLGFVLMGSAAASAHTATQMAEITAALSPGTVMPGGVYRVAIPRDFAVSVVGVARSGSALGGYAVFATLPSRKAVLVGDPCLLELEVDPVVTTLRKEGIMVTLLRDRVRDASPRAMFVHLLGTGDAVTLAQDLRRALTMTGTFLSVAQPSTARLPFAAEAERIIERRGTSVDGMLAISVPRAGGVSVFNLADVGDGRIAGSGDLGLRKSEVESTVAALRSHGFEVIAMHEQNADGPAFVATTKDPHVILPSSRRSTMVGHSQSTRRFRMVARLTLAVALGALLVAPPTSAQTTPDAAGITAALGRPGTAMPGGVYRVGLPRADLAVTLDGVPLRPGLALGSYAAFEALSGKTLVVGDLCLLEREIEPVMTQLQKDGIEVTALHNHLRNESPHVMFLHFLGVGDATTLAQSLHRALAVTGTPLAAPPPAPSAEPPSFLAEIQRIIGRTGNTAGGVLSISVPRAEKITMRGMPLTPGMGVTNALNFQDAGSGRVATTGDYVLIASEVDPTVEALRSHGFAVTAMHQHMIGDDPTLYYVHFWRVGSPAEVAGGLRDALSHVHTAS